MDTPLDEVNSEISRHSCIDGVHHGEVVKIVGNEDGCRTLVVLLAQHHELHALGALWDKGMVAHLRDIGTLGGGRLAPRGLPVVLILDFHDDTRPLAVPVGSVIGGCSGWKATRSMSESS